MVELFTEKKIREKELGGGCRIKSSILNALSWSFRWKHCKTFISKSGV
jgi:hypothetical protein